MVRYNPTGVPGECVLAVWLWRHPMQTVFIDKTWYVYDDVKKGFYYRKPDNKIRCDWYRASGMDDYLSMAMKYFSQLCKEEQS